MRCLELGDRGWGHLGLGLLLWTFCMTHGPPSSSSRAYYSQARHNLPVMFVVLGQTVQLPNCHQLTAQDSLHPTLALNVEKHHSAEVIQAALCTSAKRTRDCPESLADRTPTCSKSIT